MGEALGSSLVTDYAIKSIDLRSCLIDNEYHYETLITSIPWTHWKGYSSLPSEIGESIELLKYASIDVDYRSDTLNNNSHWIYEPDESINYHRMLLRSNFVTESRGYWTETNSKRSLELKENEVRFHNKFAYPINTIEKPETVQKILNWASSNSIVGLGRWGRWEHMNSDVAVAEALQMATELNSKVMV
jgi:UDP-galactopyranose mutase